MDRRIIIFSGPTLTRSRPRAENLEYRAPAKRGDVYHAAREKPWGIGIVDGYFARVPPVWHKEVLWALSRGVRVYGAASMGALRAAELAPFGMVGVGQIFEWLVKGAIDRDDEVAVAHASEEFGFRPTSEALVNIRATLARAREAGICSADMESTLLRIAASTYYAERSWPGLLAAAQKECGIEPVGVLRTWLKSGAIDQKREDALQMIDRMLSDLASEAERFRADFHFNDTDAWRVAEQRFLEAERATIEDALLEELQLRGNENECTMIRAAAWLRGMASRSIRGRQPASGEYLQRVATDFRAERQLHSQSDMLAWLARRGMQPDEFKALLQSEAGLHDVLHEGTPCIRAGLRAQLQGSEQLFGLEARAVAKRALLGRCPLPSPPELGSRFSPEELVRWYFEEHIRRAIPEDLELFSWRLGFESQRVFVDALRRERWFVEAGKPASTALPDPELPRVHANP
jgi:hypothetical protein